MTVRHLLFQRQIQCRDIFGLNERNNSELEMELFTKRADELSCRTEIEQMGKAVLKRAVLDNRARPVSSDSSEMAGPEARAARRYDRTVPRPPLQGNSHCFRAL